MGEDHKKMPCYLAAFTANNSPREDWGPKKRANQSGSYAHLSINPVNSNTISTERRSQKLSLVKMNAVNTTTIMTNSSFDPDFQVN